MFDPEHGRVILSRNVVFNEKCCGGFGAGGSGVGGSGVGGSGVGDSGVGGFGVGGFGDAGAGGSGAGGSGAGGTDQYMVLDFDDTQAESQSQPFDDQCDVMCLTTMHGRPIPLEVKDGNRSHLKKQ